MPRLLGEITAYLILFAVLILIGWLVGWFVSMEWDVRKWDQASRAGLLAYGILFTCGLAVANYVDGVHRRSDDAE